MKRVFTLGLSLCAALSMSALDAGAQGKGKGNEHKDHGKAQQADKSKEMKAAKAVRRNGDVAKVKVRTEVGGDIDRSDKAVRKAVKAEVKDDRKVAKRLYKRRDIALADVPSSYRSYFSSDRVRDRVAVGALARAFSRGVDQRVLLFVPSGDRLRINRGDVVLVDLHDDRARDLGRWDVYPLSDDNVKSGSPSFCRSGEGHPVWGRQWCLDKGFGLGERDNLRWGYTRDLGDVTFRRVDVTNNLAREALIGLLGERAFNRLALHAITLGLVDPLVGNWIGEPTGSRVLYLTSGRVPVAEIVDVNRDGRADRMIVALRSW